jgi:hypothetical protein
MSSIKSLPDLLQRTHEVRGEVAYYRFANGLQIKTEAFSKNDPLRILPLGTPQGSLMNHMLNFPAEVQNERVFEPFAGSGALGFMALKVGAKHVDFLDINPRASDFQRENAALNHFSPSQFTLITADIADFTAQGKYDLVLANPPFVPTPEGIEGTITSNGGPEGSTFVEILLARLEDFLEPSGRALIYVFQLVKDARPLILDSLAKTVQRRPVELTPAQAAPIPFEIYIGAYRQLFPNRSAAIERWQTDLIRKHGRSLGLCHYVMDVGPRSDGPVGYAVRENFAEKFGQGFLVPSEKARDIAFGRVFENLVTAPVSGE